MAGKNGMGMKIFGVIVTLLILISLISIGSLYIFGFDLLLWVSFGSVLVSQILAGIVAVIGIIGLLMLIISLFRN